MPERYVDETARPDHLIACPSCSAVLCYRCGIYEEKLNQYADGAGDQAWWRRVTRDYQRHKERDHTAPARPTEGE